jgi:hypothetical protein
MKVKSSPSLIKHHSMKPYEGVEVQLHRSYPLQYLKVISQLHASVALTPKIWPPAPTALEIRWTPQPI